MIFTERNEIIHTAEKPYDMLTGSREMLIVTGFCKHTGETL